MTLTDGILLRICRGPTCGKRSDEIAASARSHIEANGLGDRVEIDWQSCFGRCTIGPTLLVEHWRNGRPNENAMLAIMLGTGHPDMCFEQTVKATDVPQLIDRQLEDWQNAVDRHNSVHGAE
jgi:hypothetical protein